LTDSTTLLLETFTIAQGKAKQPTCHHWDDRNMSHIREDDSWKNQEELERKIEPFVLL
jgi:hypothetical protein